MIELLLEAERARSSGQDERAEQLYRQVAQADPHNAIAVVGLALLAVDRGDDLGAYLLARRALTIDPEDDAARRLAARLEDGLAVRGAPVTDPTSTAASVPIVRPSGDLPSAVPPAMPPAVVPKRRRSVLDRLLGRGR